MSPKTQSFNCSPLYLVMNIPIIPWPLSHRPLLWDGCWVRWWGWRDSRPLTKRERGEPFPSNPLFQGLLSVDLHMKWYLIHSHSVEFSKSAVAGALAEGWPSHKAFNWPVIRLWNCVACQESSQHWGEEGQKEQEKTGNCTMYNCITATQLYISVYQSICSFHPCQFGLIFLKSFCHLLKNYDLTANRMSLWWATLLVDYNIIKCVLAIIKYNGHVTYKWSQLI